MGKSLLGFAKNFVVLDIETTGLNAIQNEIIEFAAVRVENCEITAEFSSLINLPLRFRRISLHSRGFPTVMWRMPLK